MLHIIINTRQHHKRLNVFENIREQTNIKTGSHHKFILIKQIDKLQFINKKEEKENLCGTF